MADYDEILYEYWYTEISGSYWDISQFQGTDNQVIDITTIFIGLVMKEVLLYGTSAYDKTPYHTLEQPDVGQRAREDLRTSREPEANPARMSSSCDYNMQCLYTEYLYRSLHCHNICPGEMWVLELLHGHPE